MEPKWRCKRQTGTDCPMTGLTNSPLPPGRNCRPFPDQLASRSADDGSAKSWLGQAKRLEARRHCRSQCEDRALTKGHERSSLFIRKFRPAHSHHNASASWHESAATRMQMFATGSKLTPNLHSGLIHARFRHGGTKSSPCPTAKSK